jgi:hypothetical protein
LFSTSGYFIVINLHGLIYKDRLSFLTRSGGSLNQIHPIPMFDGEEESRILEGTGKSGRGDARFGGKLAIQQEERRTYDFLAPSLGHYSLPRRERNKKKQHSKQKKITLRASARSEPG